MKKTKNIALILAVTLMTSCAFPQQSAAQTAGETIEKLSEASEPENESTEMNEPEPEKQEAENSGTMQTETSEEEITKSDLPETDMPETAEPKPQETNTAEAEEKKAQTPETALPEEGDETGSNASEKKAETADMKRSYRAGSASSGIEYVSVGQSYEGSVSASETEKFYWFELYESGKLTLTASAGNISRLRYTISDIDDEKLLNKTSSSSQTTNLISINEELELTAGTYYFSLNGNGGSGDFSFQFSFISAEESFEEINGGTDNERGYANPVEFNTSYRGQIAKNDNIDFYKFTLDSSGRISLKASVQLRAFYCFVYDQAGNELWNKYFSRSSSSQAADITNEMDLTKGTYYFALRTTSSANTGNYSFRLTFKDSGESFSETRGGTNNSLSKSDAIRSNVTYKGQIAVNDKKDFYKFTVTESSDVTLAMTAEIPWIYYHIYNSSGKELWRQSMFWNKTTERSSLTKSINLSKGTYYFVAEQYSSYTGNYSFRIHTHSGKNIVKKATTKKNGSITRKCSCGKVLSKKTIYRPKKMKLSKTTYVYNGKKRKPSVKITDSKGKVISSSNYKVTYSSGRKKVGKYKVTVKFKGNYKGKMTKTFRIKARK